MTREELWAEYIRKNPSFAGDRPITLSPAGLKKLFEQTWEHGADYGFTNGRAYGEMEGARRRDASNIFEEIFRPREQKR